MQTSHHDGHAVWRPAGAWVLAEHGTLQALTAQPLPEHVQGAQIDLRGLDALDTSGAQRLVLWMGPQRLSESLAAHPPGPEREALLRIVAEACTRMPEPGQAPTWHPITDFFAHVGDQVLQIRQQVIDLLGFIGLTLQALARTCWHPGRWRLTPLVAQIEQVGLNAVPLVLLLTFLVGCVVAFLGSTVLSDFGANQFVVHLISFSFLREFGVLLTAILMAGRTASAFTAQIGSMKANEEIDALRTLGLDPIEILVLPRLLAMMISLPLLTFLAMISGIVGGALVSVVSLGLSPNLFLSILQNDIAVRHLFVGLGKAPVFAALIALVGCLEGFKAKGSARSVGEHTTSAVVQSIFLVILVNAVAALFFMEMKW